MGVSRAVAVGPERGTQCADQVCDGVLRQGDAGAAAVWTNPIGVSLSPQLDFFLQISAARASSHLIILHGAL